MVDLECAPLRYRITDITEYSIQSRDHSTELTGPCYIPVMSSTRKDINKYQFGVGGVTFTLAEIELISRLYYG